MDIFCKETDSVNDCVQSEEKFYLLNYIMDAIALSKPYRFNFMCCRYLFYRSNYRHPLFSYAAENWLFIWHSESWTTDC